MSPAPDITPLLQAQPDLEFAVLVGSRAWQELEDFEWERSHAA